jgi:hypothetical protein
MASEPVALFITLYLDADISRHLAELLRNEGFDVVSAWEVSHEAWSDAKQLAYAAENQRAILTYDLGDYPPLAQEYFEAGRDHFGIILSEQLPIGELRRRMLRLLDRVTRDEMINNVRFLSDFADRE